MCKMSQKLFENPSLNTQTFARVDIFKIVKLQLGLNNYTLTKLNNFVWLMNGLDLKKEWLMNYNISEILLILFKVYNILQY